MKLTITHLKAPWPAGAAVGDVIELASMPAWAAGKCEPAADDAEATIGYMLTEDDTDTATGDGSGQALPEIGTNAEPEPPRRGRPRKEAA